MAEIEKGGQVPTGSNLDTADLRPAHSLGSPIRVPKAPESGDSVRGSDGTSHRLGTQLGGGGEGTVYATKDPELVCKIYNSKKLTTGLREKLELMVGCPVDHPSVCWPRSSVVDASLKFPLNPGALLQ